jgi:hypothetical protein
MTGSLSQKPEHQGRMGDKRQDVRQVSAFWVKKSKQFLVLEVFYGDKLMNGVWRRSSWYVYRGSAVTMEQYVESARMLPAWPLLEYPLTVVTPAIPPKGMKHQLVSCPSGDDVSGDEEEESMEEGVASGDEEEETMEKGVDSGDEEEESMEEGVASGDEEEETMEKGIDSGDEEEESMEEGVDSGDDDEGCAGVAVPSAVVTAPDEGGACVAVPSAVVTAPDEGGACVAVPSAVVTAPDEGGACVAVPSAVVTAPDEGGACVAVPSAVVTAPDEGGACVAVPSAVVTAPDEGGACVVCVDDRAGSVDIGGMINDVVSDNGKREQVVPATPSESVASPKKRGRPVGGGSPSKNTQRDLSCRKKREISYYGKDRPEHEGGVCEQEVAQSPLFDEPVECGRGSSRIRVPRAFLNPAAPK